MDRLKLVLAVSDVLLNVYSTKQDRKARLIKEYGEQGAEEIEKEVNFCIGNSLEDKYLAVACIADHYGKNKEREEKLPSALFSWQTISDFCRGTSYISFRIRKGRDRWDRSWRAF